FDPFVFYISDFSEKNHKAKENNTNDPSENKTRTVTGCCQA
ncbi:MAG: hypothetical protein QG641_893, partial [Candidatus Poribacteria bacterium]|nr:hypothetical protein [Candidatus Poribacteria bacterium]